MNEPKMPAPLADDSQDLELSNLRSDFLRAVLLCAIGLTAVALPTLVIYLFRGSLAPWGPPGDATLVHKVLVGCALIVILLPSVLVITSINQSLLLSHNGIVVRKLWRVPSTRNYELSQIATWSIKDSDLGVSFVISFRDGTAYTIYFIEPHQADRIRTFLAAYPSSSMER